MQQSPQIVAQILASGPDNDVYAIEAFYFAAITSAKERLWLTTPYFVPGEAILAAIASAAHRGVDVRLLLPHATDSRWVDAAGRTFHDELLAAGAQIYLYEAPMLHAKTAVVDDALAIVGFEPIMRATLVRRVGEDEYASVELFDTVAPRLLGFDEPTRFSF